jgi:hypothetical protein
MGGSTEAQASKAQEMKPDGRHNARFLHGHCVSASLGCGAEVVQLQEVFAFARGTESRKLAEFLVYLGLKDAPS